MLRVTADNIGQQRTLRPLYAQHQATPYGGFLDPAWNRSHDIYPDMVVAKYAGELFRLYTGANAEVPWGLSELFVAPVLGIDEVRNSNTNLFTAWVGGSDSVFAVLAPAFDTSFGWVNPTDGSEVRLRVTKASHPLGPGLLTGAAAGTNVSTESIATLVEVVGSNEIHVSLKSARTAA